jgi:hypothetical protein
VSRQAAFWLGLLFGFGGGIFDIISHNPKTLVVLIGGKYVKIAKGLDSYVVEEVEKALSAALISAEKRDTLQT